MWLEAILQMVILGMDNLLHPSPRFRFVTPDSPELWTLPPDIGWQRPLGRWSPIRRRVDEKRATFWLARQ